MNKEKIFVILKNIVAVIVIISLFVIIFYQNRDRDLFKFGKSESGTVVTGTQNGSASSVNGDISRLGDDVVYLTSTSMQILDEKAEGETVSMALSVPQLHSEGEFAVCYGKNSQEASVYKKDRLYYHIKADNTIIRAKVNENGYLLLITEKEGYNCECKVFNRSGEAVFKWDVSKSEFLDGDINCNNDLMALSLTSAGNEKLVGEVVLIDITDAEVVNRELFDSKVFYSADFNRNNTFTALGSHSLSYFNADGTEKWSYVYGEDKLIKADVSNPNMMVLAFLKDGSVVDGNTTTVRVVNRLGKVTAENSFQGIADDVAVSEDAIALAFGKKIHVVNSSLHEKKLVETASGVKKVALFNDNKHLFIIGASGGEIVE